MASRRNPLTDPKSGDVFSLHGAHYEISDVTRHGIRYREWHRDNEWMWMSRRTFSEWVRQGVIGRTRAEWIAEMR